MWVSSECDFPRKIITKYSGDYVYDSEMTATSLSEAVRVGQRMVPCVRMEGRDTAEAGVALNTTWLSVEVPGAVVKTRSVVTKWGVVKEFSVDLLDFGGERHRR